MEAYFTALADTLDSALVAGEQHATWFEAERTDFVRLNRGKVRQPGSVEQRHLTIRLVRGGRHAAHRLALTGALARDGALVHDALSGLRSVLADVAEDPHLLLPDRIASSRAERGGPLPPAEQVIDEVLAAAGGLDLVGIYAAGPVYRAFANDRGQRNWHAATTFNLAWSLYHRSDKAVKSALAGFAWDPAAFAAKMGEATRRLALIARPAKRLEPGRYRAYLAPAAVDELTGLLGWGGFSGRSLETRQSPLMRMKSGETMSPAVSLAEDVGAGVAPLFQAEGFVRPGRVPLIENGTLVGSLVSPRTAREFGLAENGANGFEMPEALAMAGGTLPERDALAALDTGLVIGNLWYANFSDRPACRVTGMTRFATFWAERGEIVAPVDVLRFDDTLYRLLGGKLEALTDTPEIILSSESYKSRQLASSTVPGALVAEMAFTL